MFISNAVVAHTFKLCLFDLDQTLVESSRLAWVRFSLKDSSPEQALKKIDERRKSITPIISQDLLKDIKKTLPNLKFGVFTRSHKSYANAVLSAFYPDFNWDVVVCYEDVPHTKPLPDGINHAMKQLDITDPLEVIMVGDDDDDMYAAILAGVRRILFTYSWPNSDCWSREQWNAYGTIPDAVINDPYKLKEILLDIRRFVPDLESALETASDGGFEPQEAIKRRSKDFRVPLRTYWNAATRSLKHYWVFIAGRYYTAAMYRNHSSTETVLKCKHNANFYKEWYDTFWDFLNSGIFPTKFLVLTVIPAHQGKIERMEIFLSKFFDYLESEQLHLGKVHTVKFPELFAYTPGTRSHHEEHLNASERRENVDNHLMVQANEKVLRELVQKGATFVIIDDVCTSGASLIGATIKLVEKGIPENRIVRFAFTSTVGVPPAKMEVNPYLEALGC